jgi:5-methylcytosine-specific restriction enzyme A
MATKPRIFGQRENRKPRGDFRKPAHKRGYDKRWKRLRDDYIADYPLCEHCERKGLTTIAREVDHIIEFEGLDDQKRLDRDNLQSLCRSCHAKKTAKDKRR